MAACGPTFNNKGHLGEVLKFVHLDSAAAPILGSIAERLEQSSSGLIGIRLAFDKDVAASLFNKTAWRAAHSQLMRNLLAHVRANDALLGLELSRVPLPAMYCNELSAALRSISIPQPRHLQFLRLDGCKLCRASVTALLPALIACDELRLLDLSRCGLCADAAEPLSELLRACGWRSNILPLISLDLRISASQAQPAALRATGARRGGGVASLAARERGRVAAGGRPAARARVAAALSQPAGR